MAKKELKAECIRLRQEERLSYKEIAERTGAAKGTLSDWLRPYPLSAEEARGKRLENWRKTDYASQPERRRRHRGDASKYHEMATANGLDRDDMSRIAESAAIFRMSLFKLVPFGSFFDGAKQDMIVRLTGINGSATVQVKCAQRDRQRGGAPVVRLVCSDGRGRSRRYRDGEFDFIVGYDLFMDTAYVFSEAEVSGHRQSIAVHEDFAERWDKVVEFIRGKRLG